MKRVNWLAVSAISIFAVLLASGSVANNAKIEEDNDLIRWVESHPALVGLLVTLGGAVGSGLTVGTIRLLNSQRDLGRRKFLEEVTTQVKLDFNEVLSDKVEPVKATLTDIKDSARELKARVDTLQDRVYDITTELKVIQALRLDLLDKLEGVLCHRPPN